MPNRGASGVRLLLCLACASGLCGRPAAAAEGAKPTLSLATDAERRSVFELRGLRADDVASLSQKLEKHFAVYSVLDAEIADQPPLAGRYEHVGGTIRFTPRFPLQPGMRYRAVYRAGGGVANDGAGLTEVFVVPAAAARPASRVAAVYPSAATLPENQLKFYLYFTAPMSRGGAYQRLRLLDGQGKPVDLPFLELAEELWNPAGDRLTLLLDPARVKQGLAPREEVGPVLVAGRRYTLVVSRDWPDAAGHPLMAEFRKDFQVAPPDETCPSPRTWRLAIPRPATRSALIVQFGEPLDRALLARMLWVDDGQGRRVPGEIEIGSGEASWCFRPERPWRPGRYKLMADALLEDLAGNSIARKFELDARRAATPVREAETASVEFEIGPRQ
ncbi:MAG TPA: hypothetical protein VNH11_29830 [Pirellulales bacterium]|nr:hypothetical protein [Pirellulales bacterium]